VVAAIMRAPPVAATAAEAVEVTVAVEAAVAVAADMEVGDDDRT
jgi:hypothetical protein